MLEKHELSCNCLSPRPQSGKVCLIFASIEAQMDYVENPSRAFDSVHKQTKMLWPTGAKPFPTDASCQAVTNVTFHTHCVFSGSCRRLAHTVPCCVLAISNHFSREFIFILFTSPLLEYGRRLLVLALLQRGIQNWTGGGGVWWCMISVVEGGVLMHNSIILWEAVIEPTVFLGQPSVSYIIMNPCKACLSVYLSYFISGIPRHSGSASQQEQSSHAQMCTNSSISMALSLFVYLF